MLLVTSRGAGTITETDWGPSENTGKTDTQPDVKEPWQRCTGPLTPLPASVQESQQEGEGLWVVTTFTNNGDGQASVLGTHLRCISARLWLCTCVSACEGQKSPTGAFQLGFVFFNIFIIL